MIDISDARKRLQESIMFGSPKSDSHVLLSMALSELEAARRTIWESGLECEVCEFADECTTFPPNSKPIPLEHKAEFCRKAI